MNAFLTLAFLFFVGSTLGWVIELLFRRFISAKKWINPGFLIGPYLPLYGFGLCLLYLLSSVDFSCIQSEILRTCALLSLMGLAMTAIEYIAGKIFILGMHIKLWDYSKEWGNIEGIICPRFSLFWVILCAVYYFLIHPFFTEAVAWLFSNLAFSFIIGLFFGVFLIDFAYSAKLMIRIRKFAKENQIVVKLEELKGRIADRMEKRKFLRFVFAFRENHPLSETLADYREHIKERKEKIIQRIKKR